MDVLCQTKKLCELSSSCLQSNKKRQLKKINGAVNYTTTGFCKLLMGTFELLVLKQLNEDKLAI